MTDIEFVSDLAEKVSKYNGKVYYVGGYVRDLLLGNKTKDIDIEIHNIDVPKLEEILDSYGERRIIGESFGVYNVSGFKVDIVLPRKEKMISYGHKDFDIIVDPYIGTYKSCIRRDFTINAIMKDALSDELVDHFNGLDDLKNGIIRHINDETFVEDPLRVLRGCAFASRFGFKIHDDTINLCKKMDITNLSKERIFEETKKALLSKKPSSYFYYLKEMGKLDYWYKELNDLIGVKQSPIYHAEGDVFTHTMMVLDEMAKYKEYAKSKLGIMYSALTHDFGKVLCTEIKDGRIVSHGHEALGVPLYKEFMHRLTNERDLIKYVCNMSLLHMKPNNLSKQKAKIKSTNKMFDESLDPLGLIYLSIADNYGRKMTMPFENYEDFLFERYEIYKEYMSRPYITGKDLINLGFKPNEDFTKYLDFAHKCRLAGIPKRIAIKELIGTFNPKK